MSPSLRPQLRRTLTATTAALELTDQLDQPVNFPKHYIAELILLRIFAFFESVVEEIACRLVCGASYCDGSKPTLLRNRPTRSNEKALQAMQSYNRSEPRYRLRWNQAKEIADNLETLFPENEHFVATIRNHGQLISDLRKVRNHIAHRNQGTYKKFQEVVLRRYGARIPSMTPGRMLVSHRFSPNLVEEWSRAVQILTKAAIRG